MVNLFFYRKFNVSMPLKHLNNLMDFAPCQMQPKRYQHILNKI